LISYCAHERRGRRALAGPLMWRRLRRGCRLRGTMCMAACRGRLHALLARLCSGIARRIITQNDRVYMANWILRFLDLAHCHHQSINELAKVVLIIVGTLAIKWKQSGSNRDYSVGEAVQVDAAPESTAWKDTTRSVGEHAAESSQPYRKGQNCDSVSGLEEAIGEFRSTGRLQPSETGRVHS